MPGDYWIKLYIEVLDDTKMATLPDRLWRRFFELCLFAGREGKGGLIPDIKQISWLLRVPIDDLLLDIRQLEAIGLIRQEQSGWLVKNFAKRQAPSTASERTRRFRESQHHKQYVDEDETNLKRNVSQINRLTDTENRLTESETEQTSSTPFDTTRQFIETLTGLPAMPQSIKAIDEIVQIGCSQEDITAGYRWYQENTGRPLKYYGQLVGPARTAMAQRLRANNTQQQPGNSIVDQVVTEVLNARKREKNYD